MDKEFKRRSEAVLRAISILAKAEPSVVFVGGSAIQAMLDKPKRLSIDLDLAYRGDPKNLTSILSEKGYEIEERKAHDPMFVFYSATKDDTMIKLDIVRLSIPETEAMKINGVSVKRPKSCYFMASKLAALAFGTVGRRDEQKFQVIKDIYDIDCLLGSSADIGNIGTDWARVVGDEGEIRKRNYSPDECLTSAEKTLLRCLDATGSPSAYITPNDLRDFGSVLLEGKLNRYDFPVMAARVMLLAAHMEKGFYKIDETALTESKSKEKLDEAERILKSKQVLPVTQIDALKLTAPRALMYLKYWYQKRRGDQPMLSTTPGIGVNPRFS